jgi:hypothetical protein
LRLDPNSDVISTKVKGICAECIVLSAQTDIAAKDGSKKDISSGIYSHHIIMTSIGHPMVPPPTIVRCPNGGMGGFNFAGMGPQKKPGGTASGMAGMSHSGAKPPSAAHSKRQFPGMAAISVFVGQGDDATAMIYRQKGSKINSGFYVKKTDQFNLMSYVYSKLSNSDFHS